jgi:uncharacterized Zn finger protein (UPF0148 family)
METVMRSEQSKVFYQCPECDYPDFRLPSGTGQQYCPECGGEMLPGELSVGAVWEMATREVK